MTNPDPKFTFFRMTPRRRRIAGAVTAVTLVVAGMGAFALLPPVRTVKVANDQNIQLAQAAPRPAPRMLQNAAPFSFADLVERVSPAVVTITAEGMTAPSRDAQEIPEPFREFFERFGQGQQQQPRRAVSAGSGFIIDKAGYLVTNNHVVEDATKITVRLPDKRSFTAKLIGTDPSTDIALLKIESDKPLPAVEFGNDRGLRVGDWVIAVGTPFSLGNSVTAGIVSALGRDVGGASNYTDFIQIDAPINRGNSGGPTFDLRGQVVGMNSMIYSPSGGSVGIGFAIPASTIHDVVDQLKSKGKVARGFIGVNIQPVTPEIASALGLKDAKGALVAEVTPGGPAAKAGFEQGDIVMSINGQPVEDSRDLQRRVALVAAGQTASFDVNRQGKAMQLRAVIGARPAEQVASAAPTRQNAPAAATTAMGLGLAALTPEQRRSKNLSEGDAGVLITRVDPDSDAADKGLQAGDVVLRIGNRSVRTPEDVRSGVSDAQKSGRKSVLLLVSRASGGTGFFAVEIGEA